MTTTNPDCPSTRRHGTGIAYRVDRCRCPDARAANTRTQTLWRLDDMRGVRRLIPAVGSQRRIRALIAAGWPKKTIASWLGIAAPRLDVLLRQRTVHRSTAARIAAVYREYADRPGPSPEARGQARRLGYVPPVGWDEDTIDDPDTQPWAVLCDDGVVRHGEALATGTRNRWGSTPAQRAVWDERKRARRAAAAAVREAEVGAMVAQALNADEVAS